MNQSNLHICSRQKVYDDVHTWVAAQGILDNERAHALKIPLYFVRRFDVRTNTGFRILYVHVNHAEPYSRMLNFSTCTLKCDANFIKMESRSRGYLMLNFYVSVHKQQIPCCISEDIICWQFEYHLHSAHRFLLDGGQTAFIQRPLQLSRNCDDWSETLRTAAIFYKLPQHAYQRTWLRDLAINTAQYFACMARAATTETSVESVYENLIYCLSVLKYDFGISLPMIKPLIVRQCINNKPDWQCIDSTHSNVHVLCGHWVVPDQKNWVEPCAERCMHCSVCAVTKALSTDIGNHILTFLKLDWTVNNTIVEPHIARICFEIAQNTY